jgi:hypothetical protein
MKLRNAAISCLNVVSSAARISSVILGSNSANCSSAPGVPAAMAPSPVEIAD